jgi:Zn-dependent peptidase ImmA (M78 family)
VLRIYAERRWAGDATADITSEQERVAAFEDAHNLANAFAGTFGLPPLWFVRSLDQMIVETVDGIVQLPHLSAMQALERAGDQIARRLRSADDARWARLLEAWDRRDQGEGRSLLAWSLGVSETVASDLISHRTLLPPISVTDAANDDELRIAARMAGALKAEQIATVVDTVRRIPPHPQPRLDQLTDKLGAHMQTEDLVAAYPYQQGVAAARWIREHIQHAPIRSIDPERVLKSLDVDVLALPIGRHSLDALAVWGRQHGPGIVINTESSRFTCAPDKIWRNGAARNTLAHEFCHLLLDREHALSVVDVLRHSRVPERMEQRANAFAAEFLLPATVAATEWRDAGSPLDRGGLSRLLKRLSMRFGVTYIVVSWQIEHGVGQSALGDLSTALNETVPHRIAPFAFGT